MTQEIPVTRLANLLRTLVANETPPEKEKALPVLEAQGDALEDWFIRTLKLAAKQHLNVGDYCQRSSQGKAVYTLPRDNQLARVTAIFDSRLDERGLTCNGEISVVNCSHGVVETFFVDLRYFDRHIPTI